MKKEWGIFLGLVTIFLLAYFLNFTDPKIQARSWKRSTCSSGTPATTRWPASCRPCSSPGPSPRSSPRRPCCATWARKPTRSKPTGVASVSGTVLAVCSCSVLPMFAGIYRVGAGLGPASAFLYSGPAINVMAIFLTARVLGFDLGIARVIGSVSFAVIIGLIMAAVFRKDEEKREVAVMQLPDPPPAKRSLWQTRLSWRHDRVSGLQRLGQSQPDDHRKDRRHEDAGRRAVGNHRDVPGAARGAGGRAEERREADHPEERDRQYRTTRRRKATSGPAGST